MSLRIGGVRFVWLALLPSLGVLGALNLVAVAERINSSLHQAVPNGGTSPSWRATASPTVSAAIEPKACRAWQATQFPLELTEVR